MSGMEQEASEESGDLYSAFAKLRQSVEFVGDIGRYWYFRWNIDRRTGHVLHMGRQDIPGVHYDPDFRPRLMPAHTGGGAPVGDPNDDRQSPAGSGSALPDLFAQRDWSAPWDPTAAGPNAFIPSDAAIIPFSPQLERCGATYFAFSQPGTHRITVSNHIAADTMEVQEDGGRQRIWWDLTVSDVDVRCAALPVSENATLVLLQTQRATIRVTPNNDRRYALRLPDPEGTYLRLDGDSVVEAQATDTIDDQPLEADRLYRRNADGTYDTEVLNAHRTNSFSDIRIPVRRFNLRVIHALHFRTAVPPAADLAADITALHVAEVRPGAVIYVLVPCAILDALSHGAVVYPGTAPASGHSDPAPTREIEDTPAELTDYIGDGGIFKLTFGAEDPPQESAQIPYTVHVGRAGNDAVLTGSITLKPHFRLTHPAGYQVARDSSLTLDCGTEAGDPTAKIGDVRITPDGGITPTVAADRMSVTLAVATDAAVGIRTLLVEDQDHAGHFGVRTIEVI